MALEPRTAIAGLFLLELLRVLLWSGNDPNVKHCGLDTTARMQQQPGEANATAHTDATSWPTANHRIKCAGITAYSLGVPLATRLPTQPTAASLPLPDAEHNAFGRCRQGSAAQTGAATTGIQLEQRLPYQNHTAILVLECAFLKSTA